MRIEKFGRQIQSVEEWFAYAPPKKGALQWQDYRSAKELARAWFRRGVADAPEELREVLQPRFGTLNFELGEPECVIRLDEYRGEHRNCDLVVLCSGVRDERTSPVVALQRDCSGQEEASHKSNRTTGAAPIRIVLSVEAKADECFGEDLVGDYYDRMGKNPASNVPRRIERLSMALFNRPVDDAVRALRYQLLHSAVATLIAAKEHWPSIPSRENSADASIVAVFVVHKFLSNQLDQKKVEKNSSDWQRFISMFPQLANSAIGESQLLGPLSVPGSERVPASIPLYLASVVTELVPLPAGVR